MLILCYDYSGSDDCVSEQLFRLSEWISAYAAGCRFFIREDRASWAALLGSDLRRVPSCDYIL